MKISIKLVYQHMVIFFNFSPTSKHLHPLQVENCDSNSRLLVDEDDDGKVRLERVNPLGASCISTTTLLCKARRQYPLTCKVSRCYLLLLHGNLVVFICFSSRLTTTAIPQQAQTLLQCWLNVGPASETEGKR